MPLKIFISTETAARNARRFNTSLDDEVTLYLIHGILHLLGFDDHAPKDIARMRRKEQEILKILNPKR